MASTPEEWLEKAISEEYINNVKFDKFTDPIHIGMGDFGRVYKYEWKDCDLTVALKCLKVDPDGLDEKIVKDFVKELKLLLKVSNHPNMIKFYGVTKDNQGYYNLILQHAEDGNLRDYLKANFKTLQWTDKLNMAKEIVLGLLFLHDNDIVHRDLHSKNILIQQKQPKLADFVLSKRINELPRTPTTFGMDAYVDPKFLQDPGWEILDGFREDPVEGTPPQYIELYQRCWDINPDKRPETKEILDILKQIPDEN
ncbi:kinase-like protein [Gigaspora margarita]|uniref:Kinase-like protein n=1 Tax=Gigaspora margarita TaxID=4874 RepID=A0A8H3WVI5_GIGMA|nr:kinase-like protein [Gigaspora margarita]